MLTPMHIAALLRRLQVYCVVMCSIDKTSVVIGSIVCSLAQVRPAMLGEGHIRMFGTLEIGHLVHPGVQRLQCYPWAELRYYGFNREDFVFVRPPGVQSFVLSPDNVWYGRLKLLFRITVKVDGKDDPVDMDCAYISFCYDIKLEPSGT